MSDQGESRILVVDDEEHIRSLISGALPEENLSVVTASTREEALDLVSEQIFDLVIVDKQLPDGSGLDVIDAIQRREHNSQAIVITAFKDTDSAIQAVSLGVFRYILKPFDIKALRTDVLQALETARLKNDLAKRTQELMAMNQALADREARYRVLFNSGNDAILVFPLDDSGKPMPFIEVNDRACELLGYSKAELIELSIGDVMHADEDAALPGFISSLLVRKQLLFEMTAIAKDGAEVPVEVSSRLFEFSGGATIFAVVRDIAERRANEEERKRLEMQFRESQKMEAIGRLAGGVAHDMNNVLGAIMGLASALEAETIYQEHWNKDVTGILKACRKGRDLTKNLLGFARKGKYVLEQVSFNALVEDVVGMLTRLAPKKVSFKTVLEEDLSLIEGDSGQLNHALMNVCLNAVDAVDATGRSGIINISTKTVNLDETWGTDFQALSRGAYVRVQIQDDGVGMKSDVLEHACEPFYTTKPAGKGTGLGLSMVYGTINNHFGTVKISSEQGRGTVVSIYLPVSKNTEVRGVIKSVAPPRLSQMHGQGTILLVDDEPMVRNAAKRLLGRLGYEVILARDGREALCVYREAKDNIWLVVLDLIMPAMDGEEVFLKLREIDDNVPVLLSSGYSKEEKADELLNMGAAGFLQKPFDIESLSQELDKIKQLPPGINQNIPAV